MCPGQDTIIQTAMERRNLPALFAALPLLRGLEAEYVARIAADIEWFSVPGGTTLFETGQEVDGLYVVINGGLATYARDAGGGSRPVGRVVAGETVGELELIAGTPRTVTAIAIRDTDLARLSTRTFDQLIVDHPDRMRLIARLLTQRLTALQSPGQATRAMPKTLAVLPHAPDVDCMAFADALAGCLRQVGRCEVVNGADSSEQTSQWFHKLERDNEQVIYVADSEPTNWTQLCLRRADLLLLAARPDRYARPWPALRATAERPPTKAAELVLIEARGDPVRPIERWLGAQEFRRHHHVRDAADIARLSRLLTGRATGLVLSGGGARGFAHIGVLRALREARVEIDAIGGTSIGAIIGAGFAAGWDHREMIERIRRSFVDSNPLNDYTLPLISLVSGRKVGRLLQREFGDANIEDLAVPFYCVSANLTTGQAAIHRRGKLWFWLRASVAIPGVLPPVCTQGQVHVDGATINNLPVDSMRDTLDGTVIAVDVGAARAFETSVESTEAPPLWRIPLWLRAGRSRLTIMQVLLRAGMVNSTATAVGQRALTDLLIAPPLHHIDMLDWKAFEQAIDLGYRSAAETLAKQPMPATISSVAAGRAGR
jgi:NTE family protein